MKFAPRFSLLLPLLMASICTPVSGQFGSLFEGITDLFGGDDKAEKETSSNKKDSALSEADANDLVMERLQSDPILGQVFSNLGDYVTGANPAVAEGKRAYNCMTEENAGSDISRKSISWGSQATEYIAYGVLYHSFTNKDDIEVICPTDPETRALTSAANDVNKNNLRGRDLASSINYPTLSADDVYKGGFFKNKQVVSYLNGEDLNDRRAIGALVDELNEQIVVYQTSSQQARASGEVVYAVGELISTVVPEAGFVVAGLQIDIGATLRGIGTFIQSAATATETNVARRQRTLYRVSNHMRQIDSAEIEASLKNTQALLGELANLHAEVADLQKRLRA